MTCESWSFWISKESGPCRKAFFNGFGSDGIQPKHDMATGTPGPKLLLMAASRPSGRRFAAIALRGSNAGELLDALDERHRRVGEEVGPVLRSELAEALGRDLGRVPAQLAQARRAERLFHRPRALVIVRHLEGAFGQEELQDEGAPSTSAPSTRLEKP